MMIVVTTSMPFDQFDRFDSLLHLTRNDLSLSHLSCGGTVRVSPRPFKKGLLGPYRPTGETDLNLQCSLCGETAGPYERTSLERTLAHYLTGPDWETAPAQHLDDVVRFVPPEWPPRRRHRPDRRQSLNRHAADRSMEGRRRRERDRRADPTSVDLP